MKKNISPVVKCNVVKCNHVAGFTLIEVLVSMLILAVGLLGIASLQFKGMAFGTDAAIRSNMTMLAYNMAERIRMNRDNADDYASQLTDPADPSSALVPFTVPNTRPGNCTQGTAMNAQNDLNCWYQSFWISANSSHVPPGTQVTIAQLAGNTGMYSIAFNWTDREGTQRNIIYPFRP